MSQAKLEITLQDGVSPAADNASEALDTLRGGMDSIRKQLSQTNRAMRELKKGGAEGSAAFEQLKAKADQQKDALAKATAEYVTAGGTFKKVSRSNRTAGEATSFQAQMMERLGLSGARTQAVFRGLSIGAMGLAAASVAVAAGLAAVTAATVAAGAALVAYGIRQADARREESLRLEALTRLRTVYGTVGGSATALQDSIDRVADSTGASRATLEQYATRLHRMGIRGDAATAALEGAAIRGAALGDRYGAQFVGMAVAAGHAGQSVRALADDVKARLGDLAERRMLSLSNITRRWRENMAGLFRNVEIGGFLKLLNEVVKAFSQSRVTGQALAGMFSRLFSPLNSGAENAAAGVRTFAERVVLNALRVEGAFIDLRIKMIQFYLSVRPQLNKVRQILSSVFGNIDWARQIIPALAAVAGFLGAITVAAVTVGAVLAAPFVAVAAAVYGVARAYDYVTERVAAAIGSAVSFFSSLDLRGSVNSMFDGLINGIRTNAGRAVAELAAVGGSMVQALRTVLQIRSPSRVFAGLGREIPRGIAVGVEAEAPAARGAVEDVIQDTAATGGGRGSSGAASGRGAAGAGAGGRSTAITIGEIIVNAQGADASEIAANIRDQLAAALEDVLTMSGEATA